MAASYTLQILHGSDFEAGLAAVEAAPRFAAIVDRLEETQANSITLSLASCGGISSRHSARRASSIPARSQLQQRHSHCCCSHDDGHRKYRAIC